VAPTLHDPNPVTTVGSVQVEDMSVVRTSSDLRAMIEVRDSPIHGRGVFARRRIPAETLVGSYEGTRTHRDGTYVLWVEYEDGELVGIDGQNALKFLNHCAAPNTYFWGHQLYTLCEVAAGDELTFDYGEAWADELQRPPVGG
jgi:uncharacterized protein